MNLDLILHTCDLIGSHSPILSHEEGITLHNSLLLLQNENHFMNVYFWGRIYGTEKDYYIAFGYRKDALNGRTFYYSLNGVDWGLLPPPTKNGLLLTPICTTRFKGDPALVIDIMCEKNDLTLKEKFPNATENFVQALKEEDRLASTVFFINSEAALVPRGALFKRPDGVVVENSCFQGLTLLECMDMKYYFHYRPPKEKWTTLLLTQPDYSYEVDFLDSIDKDVPKGCWTIQTYAGYQVLVKSLFWPGMIFFHKLKTNQYGFVYLGTGKKVLDVPFALPTIDS